MLKFCLRELTWTRGASKKIVPYLFLQPLKLVTSNLALNLVLRNRFPKQLLGPNFAGVWARAAPPKFWDPYLFRQPWNLTSLV